LKHVQFRAPGLVVAAIGLALAWAVLASPLTPTADAGVPRAKLERGLATPPASAPKRVKRAIRAANRIAKGRSYCYGGGHSSWYSPCYDCSGAVSFAMGERGARALRAPRPSGGFMRWRARGRGRWITVYANRGHAYVVIAGLRFDTSMTPGAGPGWSREHRSGKGFRKRHPKNL